jgi:hypothetical protein
MTWITPTSLLLAGALNAAEPVPGLSAPAEQEGPGIQFSETTFDFGKVAAGQMVEHTFFMTNLSTKVVEIADVRASESGTYVAENWDRKVAPGHVGQIPVRLRMGGARGTILKAVRVDLKDSPKPQQYLLVRATRWGPIDWEPTWVSFQPVEGEYGNLTNKVQIFNRTDQALTLGPPACTNFEFKTTLKPVRPGKEFELQIIWSNSLPVSLKTKKFRSASPAAYITVMTSNTNIPVVSIPVEISPRPLFIVPESAKLETVNVGRGYLSCAFSVYSQGEWPWEISEASVNAETISTHVKREGAGNSYSVSAIFRPDLDPKENLAFTIKTTHPAVPILKIPIRP